MPSPISPSPEIPTLANHTESIIDVAVSGDSLQEMQALEEKEHSRCEKWKSQLLKSSSIAKFLLEHMEKVGCGLSPDHFACVPCDPTKAGGFSPDFGVCFEDCYALGVTVRISYSNGLGILDHLVSKSVRVEAAHGGHHGS